MNIIIWVYIQPRRREGKKNPEMSSNLRQESNRSVEENSDAFEYETN